MRKQPINKVAVKDVSRGRDGARLSQLGAPRRTADQRKRAAPNGVARDYHSIYRSIQSQDNYLASQTKK